ncbi:bifunctional adenosylcobinamide kinase/adenosylcobinamide-phosphate guanylyltransferase [Nocardioides gilvus]|uniref:bifunctional adenosylcobinamide kinase/adenosylcobinamide-phosphate guanylyltransferase n=1 Tax=Nocardioides gilvus TaxID=1735589 RepID=UPI000D741EAD|nr:bifunctional adenosylcobinamide kinase/adenosylcobinamide-phosphate guanylyltransferase [Nocardioides gilvus]
MVSVASSGAERPRTVLVTGGVRSGKSTHAERLLADEAAVVYVAPGPSPDVEQDPDWAARIEAHRSRRPAHWETVEGDDLAGALQREGQREGAAVLVDCLGTWLTSVIDAAGAWEESSEAVHDLVLDRLAAVTVAIQGHPGRIVLVTNEVGLGVVPEHRSGRLFRDLLGTVNQRVAEVCDEVHLVVAGRVLVL